MCDWTVCADLSVMCVCALCNTEVTYLTSGGKAGSVYAEQICVQIIKVTVCV